MIRPDFSSRPKRQGRGDDAALLAAGAIALAATIGLAWQARGAERAAGRTLQETTRELDQLRRREAELGARTAGAASQAVAQLLLTAEATPGRVLAEVESLMPPDVRLGSVRLVYGERLEVQMDVSARAPAAYDLFLERLAAAPLFEAVAPGSELRDGEVRGSVRLLWRGDAP